MRCPICNKLIINAKMYDPEGTIPLYGGYKEYDNEKNLINWYVCSNASCQQREKQNGKTNSIN